MNAETREVMHSSASVEWSTPQWLFDELDKEFGFVLDVCADWSNAKTRHFFDKAMDGLAQPWHLAEGALWGNFPYGRAIGKWVEKAALESDKGATVVCLLPSRTGTKWWHSWVQPILDGKREGEVRFLKGRLKFGGAKNSAPFDSVVVVFKPKQGESNE